MPPGGKTQVEVKVATARRSGKLTKAVTVETDDPERARIVLKLVANVIVDLDLETQHVRFDDAEIGTNQKKTIAFVAENPAGVQFGKVESSTEIFEGRMVEKLVDGKPSWELEVELIASQAGHQSGTVTVELLKPEKKTIKVFASARIQGDIATSPQSLTLWMKPGQEGPTSASLRVEATRGSFEILKVEETTGLLKLETETVTDGKVYLVEATLPAGATESKMFTGTLTVKTSSGSQPEIKIPVRIRPANPSQGKIQPGKPMPGKPVAAKPGIDKPLIGKPAVVKPEKPEGK